MKPSKRKTEQNSDASDLDALALVGLMIGAILTLAGIAQLHPVLSTMAEAFGATPVLSAAQTLPLGLGLVASGIGFFAWTGGTPTRRH